MIPLYQIKKYEKWDKSATVKLSEKDWKLIFTNLYKRTKQKDAFDIRYKFLHFVQPTAVKLQELREGQTSTDCPRCRKLEETHSLYVILRLIAKPVHLPSITPGNNICFDNMEKDALLTPLLE